MPQSLSRLHVHLIFSTKARQRRLADSARSLLHAYIKTVLSNLDCPSTAINSVEDHIHILFELSRTLSLCSVVEDIKKASSKWLKTQGAEFKDFA